MGADQKKRRSAKNFCPSVCAREGVHIKEFGRSPFSLTLLSWIRAQLIQNSFILGVLI